MVSNPEVAQYAIVEQRATDLGRVFASLKRDNPDIHIISHQWVHDCKAKQERLDIEGYEITRQPLPPAKKGTRTAFTPEDDMKLVKFIARYSKPKGRLGHSLYEDVEKHLPNHTAQSWRQRYKTNQARLDHEIAKYEAIVQERRDNQEDPYSDSDEEEAQFGATSGRGAWPSKVRPTQKSSTGVPIVVPVQQQNASPPVAQPFKRSAIKTQPPLQPSTTITAGQKRPFRLDFDGPGERITFSDDDSSITHTPVSSRKHVEKLNLTQETTTESVLEELAQRSFPPLASQRISEGQWQLEGSARPLNDPRAISKAESTNKVSSTAQQRLLNGGKATSTRLSARHRMTSRPLPGILTQDTWNGFHLNTLLSAAQFDDLTFVCNEDVGLATEIAMLLCESQIQGWDSVRQQRAEKLRKQMWSPEEDARLIAGQVSDKILRRHGETAVKARITYLEKQYEGRTKQEISRRRFPYDAESSD